MMFWLILAGAALFAGAWIAHPFLFPPASTKAETESTLSIYRDQLAEVDRDLAAALISASEADAAKAEIERRALHAARHAKHAAGSTSASPSSALPIIVVTAVAGLAAYAALGSPETPDQPLANRGEEILQRNADAGDVRAQVRLLALQAEATPDNLDLWLRLAQSYAILDELKASAEAFRQAAALAPEHPEIQSAFAEALSLANGNTLTDEARAIFVKVAREHGEPRARYYLAMDKAQAKDFEAALQGWISLLEDSPTDASWIPLVRRDILNMAAFLGRDPDTILPDLTPAERARSQPKAAQAPADHGLTTEDMQMAADMDEASRNEMVEGMVASLAERLQDNPEDLKGWIMLIRSYATLNRAAEARTAFETALDVFEGDAEALALLRQNAETMLN